MNKIEKFLRKQNSEWRDFLLELTSRIISGQWIGVPKKPIEIFRALSQFLELNSTLPQKALGAF
jgi:hypothetical protein